MTVDEFQGVLLFCIIAYLVIREVMGITVRNVKKDIDKLLKETDSNHFDETIKKAGKDKKWAKS